MKRSPFHKLIVSYYLKPMSAKAVADDLKALMLKNRVVAEIDAEFVLSVWREEFKHRPIWQSLERQAGPRPLHGYAPSPLIEFCADLGTIEGLAA